MEESFPTFPLQLEKRGGEKLKYWIFWSVKKDGAICSYVKGQVNQTVRANMSLNLFV